MRRVVVTGGSCISSLGFDADSAFDGLKSFKNRVVRMADWDVYKQMNTRLAAPILEPLPQYPRKKIRGAGRVAVMGLLSADNALEVAGLTGETKLMKSGRMGVAYGSSMGSIDPLLEFFSMLNTYDCSNIKATTYIRSMPQTCAVNISVVLGLTGRLVTTNTACTSGSLAIGQAYELIKYGKQDVMIAGGADELSPTESAVFDTLFARRRCRLPYSRRIRACEGSRCEDLRGTHWFRFQHRWRTHYAAQERDHAACARVGD